jgi:DNA polymerase-3 subunit beta
MKIVCDGLDLSEAVLKVSKAAAAKTTNPVLEGIKLEAKKNILILTATDLEIAIEKKIRADVIEEGEALVPARYFSDFVKKLSNQQIELFLNDKKQLTIKYMDSVGILQCLPVEEYPRISKVEEGENFIMLQPELKDLINKTIFSVSQEDSRPILKGCLWEIKDCNMTAVALDGYRLALVNKALEKQTGEFNLIVPARSLGEIGKMLSDDSKKAVTVFIHKNYLKVEIDNTTITSRLLEGEFINYNQIIPRDFTTLVTIDKRQFENGLERASILSKGDKNNLVRFDIKERILSLTSASDIGNIKENITVSLSGRDIVIAFNSRYLTDCLRTANDEFIRINMNSPVAPIVIKPADGDEYLFLILPVKLL